MAELASSLQGATHIVAIVDSLNDVLEAIPVNPILMNLVDTAPESALYYLASQFGVLGDAGWRFASTDQQRRELIKNAARLQSTKGTPAAIRTAVSTLGYGEVSLASGVTVLYDGTYLYDGEITYGTGGGHWSNFRVKVTLDLGVPITPATTEAVTALVNAYKNARSTLIDITWVMVLESSAAGLGYASANELGTAVDRVAFGPGVAPDPPEVPPTYIKEVEAVEYPDDDVQFSFILEAAEANGNILREIGLVTEGGEDLGNGETAPGGDLAAHIIPGRIIKDNTVRVEFTWTIKF